MTNDEIKEIIQVMMETGVAELEVQRGADRVWVKRAFTAMEMQTPPAVMMAPAAGAEPQQYAPQAAVQPPAAPRQEEKLPVITAPIVGTFYESASPGSGAFVKPGDTVQPGQVLCIIESMKLMNEIEAEAAGVIVANLVPNGKPVEYGEALFTYRPL